MFALYASMAAFAFAASISPGPVNVVVTTSGARHGFRRTLPAVAGAAGAFAAMLLLVGFGLAEVFERVPALGVLFRWAGVAFLFWMAWEIWRSEGRIDLGGREDAPPPAVGAAVQALNPKAWGAAVAGVSAYVGDAGAGRLLAFAALYGPISFACIALWAWAGERLRARLDDAAGMRLFARAMALLMALSAAYVAFAG